MDIPVEKTVGDGGSTLSLNCPNDSDQPLTIFVRHSVLRGHEEDFERWYNEMNRLVQQYDGFISTEIIKPVADERKEDDDADEYISIVRFQNYSKLKKWMDSDDRKGMLSRTGEFSNRKPRFTYHSVEHWFPSTTGSGGAKPPGPPPKWKMTIFVTLVICSQSLWVQKYTKKWLPNVKRRWLVLLNTLIVVTIVTYVMFPICTRLAAFWLFPQAKYTDKLLELVPAFIRKKLIKPETPPTRFPEKVPSKSLPVKKQTTSLPEDARSLDL
jgi:uncharacterized protein